jgi:hypothetical protein
MVELYNPDNARHYSDEEVNQQANDVFNKLYKDYVLNEDSSVNLEHVKLLLRDLYHAEIVHSNLVQLASGGTLSKPYTPTDWVEPYIEYQHDFHNAMCFEDLEDAVPENELTFDLIKSYFGISDKYIKEFEDARKSYK